MRKFNNKATNKIIAKNGESVYCIIANTSDCAMQYAAEELQRLIALAANVTLEILERTNGKKAIYLGTGKAMACEYSNRNGFAIKTIDEDVYIDGVDKTGLLFGVYRFMELVAGYRYLASDETLMGDCVAFHELDIYDYPDFPNRDVYNYDTKLFPEHARRLFLSGGNFSIQEPKYGEGSWWSNLWDQSLCDQLVDYREYMDKYPHWYYNNPTTSGAPRIQLCYAEALYSREEYEKGDFSEENYEDGKHGLFWTIVQKLITKYIAVQPEKQLFQLGMNDNMEFCTCERCTRDKELYGQSGVALRFVNAVADEVEKWRQANCPERKIYLTMFAYYATFDAPVKEVNGELVPLHESVKARDNVVIRFTPMAGFYMFPLTDKEHNPIIANALEGWSKVAKHFATWDYRIDFWSFIAPFPQWMGAKETIRAYYKYGFIDVMYQGCTQTTSTPFVALDNYVRSRFSWDTSQDYDEITRYFIENYYQEGSDCIKEYRAFLTEHYKMIHKTQDYKGHSHCGVTRRYNFPFESIQRIENIFQKGYEAIEKVQEKDPTRYANLKMRLDRESLFYRFMKVAFYPEHYTNEERIEEIGNFEKITNAVKLTRICNKDDFTFNVIHTLRMPLEDKKGQIIYYH